MISLPAPRLLPLLLALAAAAPAFAAVVQLPARSLSSSKQFVVYSNNAKLRSETSMRAEDLKTEFLEAVREKDGWKLPTILMLEARAPAVRRPPRSQLRIYEADDGQSKVQLDVFDTSLVDDPEFATRLLEAIVLERTYRDTPVKAGKTYERPPAWFVEGLAERLRTQGDASSAGLYASLLNEARLPKLEDFLEIQPDRLDSTSRAVYRAQAAALLDAVFSLPEGRRGLQTYLSQPRRYPGSGRELAAAFPELGGDLRGLNRRWVLAIARASAANRVELLSERDTAKQLETLLAIRALPDPKHPELIAMSGPHALPYIARSQNGPFILGQVQVGLMQLSLRAHPLYKSLVNEYLAIVRDLLAKPKRRLDKRIATAEEVRAGLTRQTNESRDYIDWVEATKIKTESREFSEALDDVETLENPEPRNDAISRYLDAVSERTQ